MKKILIFGLAMFFISVGCATVKSSPKEETAIQQDIKKGLATDRFGEEVLAASLNTNLRYPEFKNYPVIVTTFVDLNDLEKSSVFGRLMAEKLLHHLNKEGFHIVEVRRAQDLFIKKEVGELILTRDIKEIAKVTKARSIIAGTYVATTNALIINARLVDIESPQIISTYSYEIEISEEIQNLLSGESPF